MDLADSVGTLDESMCSLKDLIWHLVFIFEQTFLIEINFKIKSASLLLYLLSAGMSRTVW